MRPAARLLRLAAPFVLLAAVAALPAGLARAQDARLAGRYTLDRRASDDVVGLGLRAMGLPSVMRPMARTGRGRAILDRLAPPTLAVEISPAGAVTIRDAEVRTFAPGGAPTLVPGRGNRPATPVRAAWAGSRLVLSWGSGDTASTDAFGLDAQGRLVVQRNLMTTVERDGERRTVPLRFRLVYTRR